MLKIYLIKFQAVFECFFFFKWGKNLDSFSKGIHVCAIYHRRNKLNC